MTNEEIIQSIEDMKAALAALEQEVKGKVPPPVSINPVIDGPDEYGRVQYRGAEGHWVLSHITLKSGYNLNDQQKASIQCNVGCDEHGNLQPAGPLLFQNNQKLGAFSKPVVFKRLKVMGIEYGAPAWRPDTYIFNDKPTVASRYDTIQETVQALNQR